MPRDRCLSLQNRLWVLHLVRLTHLLLIPFSSFSTDIFFFQVNYASDTRIYSGLNVSNQTTKKVKVMGDIPLATPCSLFSALCDL
jgi:hypothetical protein